MADEAVDRAWYRTSSPHARDAGSTGPLSRDPDDLEVWRVESEGLGASGTSTPALVLGLWADGGTAIVASCAL